MLLVATVGSVISSSPDLMADCTPPPAGLVAWWPGEGNALDLAGTNNGILTNGATFAAGKVGQGFRLDGTNDYVQIPDSPALKPTNVTAEAWVWLDPNVTVGSTTEYIIFKRNSWTFLFEGYSLLKIGIDNGNGTYSDRFQFVVTRNGNQVIINSTTVVQRGVWYHVAATYDGNKSTLYVNGVAEASAIAGFALDYGTRPVFIGTSGEPAPYQGYFKGIIDEPSIYNRALTTNEIAAIYAAGSAGKCVPTITSCVTPPANLVAWWPGAGNGNDIVGGNNGSWTGFGSLNSYDSGTVGQALVFDGTHRDRVDVGNPASLQLQNLTIEAWIKRSSATIASLDDNFADGSIAGPGAYIFGYGAGGYGLFLLDAGEMGLTKNSYGDIHVAPVITDTNWHHVAVTKSGTNVTFYVDGAMLPAPGPYSDTFQFTTSAAIGSRGDGGGNTFYGKVDELSIYNRALSSNEIAAIYAASSAGKCSPAAPVVISGPITNSANGHSYFLLGGSTWTEAEAKAVTLGGHLVTINDAAENAWVLSTFGNGGTRALWIGLNDAAAEGSFVWASGDSASYRNWSSGEPNNYGGIEDYAYMGYPTYANGTWNDQPDSGYNPVSGADNRPYMFGVVEISTGTNTAPQPPVITDFSPKSGSNTIFVTVTGSNFSPAAVSNIVYFGAVRAVVSAATKTNLIVSVPVGATFAPLTVTVDGLTAFSKTKFMPTFAGSGSLLTISSFAPRFNIPSPGPGRTVIADLDGDGKPDMIVNNVTAHTVCLYKNISVSGSLTAGSFSPQIVIPSLPVADSPWDVQVGDVDGDGKLDLILANRGANIVSILRNISTPGLLGTNSFAASVNLPGGNLPLNTAVRDVDGDGRADLIVADFNSGQVAIFKNLGSPGQLTTNSFAAPVFFPAQAGTDWIAVDDLDGDGKPDIAAANANANSVSILRNTSAIGVINTNSFASQFSLSAPTYTHCVKIADIDGDGKLDMVVISVLGQSLSVYRNIGSPGTLTINSFAPRVDFPLIGRGHTISFGDLNGDSKLDVVVETELSDSVAVFQNLSAPGSFTSASFAPRLDLPTGYNAAGSSVGDLDGDGRPDILFANSYDNNISIFRNLGVIPPTITQQPASQSVVLGDWAMFNVLATGTLPFSYQWRFNGDIVTGATNSSFVLPEAQLAQAGNYSVTVANALGSVLSSNATLTVTVPVCTTAPAGIVGWWTGDGVPSDSVGTNHATLFGGNHYATGKVGQGFAFKGYTNFARIPASPALNVGTSSGFTIEGWIKPNNISAFHPMWEWNSGVQGGAIGSHFWLGHLPDSSGELYANVIGTDGTPHAFWSANGVVATNIMQHVALTYDKASGLAFITLNGKIVVQANLGSFTPKTDLDIYVGRRPSDYPGDWTYNTWFDGVIDEFSLYNRALTTNEIAAIYAARGAGKCPLQPTVLNVTPPSWYVNEGATVSYTVTAVGSPVLTYQWQHNGSDIANATNATLTLSNVVYAQAGNYAVVVSNPGGLTTSSNVLLRVNRAPIADASATDTLAISPNGTNAVVVLDGSLSSDPDGDSLTYAWFNFGETNAFATSIVAMESLPVGTNQITLTVNDGMASGSQTIAVEVITTSQAVDRLIELVQSGSGNTQPLVASLRAALAAIDRSQPAAAINQLEAFINKVHVQLEPSDPALAAQLIADAQAIIDALNGGTSVAVATVEITSLTPDHHGKAHLKIKGIKGRVHVIETSTNMVDWTPVGVAKQSADDSFEFDDSGAQDTGARFYRVVSPK